MECDDQDGDSVPEKSAEFDGEANGFDPRVDLRQLNSSKNVIKSSDSRTDLSVADDDSGSGSTYSCARDIKDTTAYSSHGAVPPPQEKQGAKMTVRYEIPPNQNDEGRDDRLPDDPSLYSEIFSPGKRDEISRNILQFYPATKKCLFHVDHLELLFGPNDSIPSLEDVENSLNVPRNLVRINKLVKTCAVQKTSNNPGSNIVGEDGCRSTLGGYASLEEDGKTFALTTGHGWTVGTSVSLVVDQSTQHHLGKIVKVISQGDNQVTPPQRTCDVALIEVPSLTKIDQRIDICNSVIDILGRERLLRLNAEQVEEKTQVAVHKFQRQAGRTAGQVDVLEYTDYEDREICKCIAIIGNEDFHREGESGLFVTRPPAQGESNSACCIVGGYGMLIAKVILEIVDGATRHVSIVQPLRETLNEIRKEDEFRTLRLHAGNAGNNQQASSYDPYPFIALHSLA